RASGRQRAPAGSWAAPSSSQIEALPARQAPPQTTISRPVHTALAPCRPRSGPAASFRHPLGRAGPAPGSVGAPTIGPDPPPAPPPDPPVPAGLPPAPAEPDGPPAGPVTRASGPLPASGAPGPVADPPPAAPPPDGSSVAAGPSAAGRPPEWQPAAATVKVRTVRRARRRTEWTMETLRIARRTAAAGATEVAMRVGFVGAGLMGAPMVRRLVAGHDVTVSSRRPERLGGEGWRVVGSPAEAAGGAEVVCSIVPDSPEVTEVVESVLEAAAEGTVVVEMSTISPATARER